MQALFQIYYDNGGMGSGSDAFGLFNRYSNSVQHQNILNAMMRAVTSSYAIGNIQRP